MRPELPVAFVEASVAAAAVLLLASGASAPMRPGGGVSTSKLIRAAAGAGAAAAAAGAGAAGAAGAGAAGAAGAAAAVVVYIPFSGPDDRSCLAAPQLSVPAPGSSSCTSLPPLDGKSRLIGSGSQKGSQSRAEPPNK